MKRMKITVVGCGSAFSHKNYHQSFLLEDVDASNRPKKMLFDCGHQIPMALEHLNINPTEIDAIIISHDHNDHIGGLEEVALSRYDWLNLPEAFDSIPELKYAVQLICDSRLLGRIWRGSLRNGLETIEGFKAGLKTFFEPIEVKINESFQWCGWDVRFVQQVHNMSGTEIKLAFGLIMKKEGHKTVYFTADSQYCSPRQISVFYNQADLIFQDCELAGVDTTAAEGFKFKFGSGIHANYAELAGYPSANNAKLPLEIKKKMWLSHFQDCKNDKKDHFGNDCDWDKLANKDGFSGFLKVGQVIKV